MWFRFRRVIFLWYQKENNHKRFQMVSKLQNQNHHRPKILLLFQLELSNLVFKFNKIQRIRFRVIELLVNRVFVFFQNYLRSFIDKNSHFFN